ncbi:hypothetical protein PVAND_006984 [Polypedilum vanderplanki]|uniref:C2H2-type domain-containing protein n=1 Tax=Polypedilum vanderplanki TaxID=319348 RepID=A0A9J6C6H9_POLVA|nr:hypothetical protein PVAND_006984 [Polypedilum vanderplanki]
MSEIIAKSELVLKPERSKDYSCKYNCGETFAFPSGKYRHERTCDKNPAKDTERFKCSYPDCNSTFSREDGLKNHVRSFHESNDKKSRQSKALMKMHEKKVAAGNVKRMKNEQVTKKKQPIISAAFNQSPSTSTNTFNLAQLQIAASSSSFLNNKSSSSSSNAKKRINNDSPTKQPQNSKKSKI